MKVETSKQIKDNIFKQKGELCHTLLCYFLKNGKHLWTNKSVFTFVYSLVKKDIIIAKYKETERK